MRALALALGLMAAPAAAAESQFDLVCKGRERLNALGKWKPYEARYRIDTAAKTYCMFECQSVAPLAEVTDGRIDFKKSDPATPSIVAVHYVDRTTGEWTYYLRGGLGLIANAEGKCEKAAFTGFPAAKF